MSGRRSRNRQEVMARNSQTRDDLRQAANGTEAPARTARVARSPSSARADEPRSDARPRATRQKSGMRETLLHAAVELFGSRGYDAVSLKDLTAEVGIKPPALYNHFKSKDDLLVAAICAALEAFNREIVDQDDPTAAPLARLEAMVRRHVLYQIEHAHFAKANDRLIDSTMLDRIGRPDTKQTVRALMRRYLDRMTEIVALLLAERREAGLDPRFCALTIGTMCDRVLVWYRPSGAYSSEKVARRMTELVRNMLCIP